MNIEELFKSIQVTILTTVITILSFLLADIPAIKQNLLKLISAVKKFASICVPTPNSNE